MPIAQFSINVLGGKRKDLNLIVDGVEIRIPVDAELFAHFQEKFVREHPSAKQKHAYVTVMNLMKTAYLQGCEDGKKR